MTSKGRHLSAAIALTLSAGAHAGMGNIGTTYGLMPTDVGTAQALSLFNTEVSAAYYNPANLIKDGRGALTFGFLHSEPELRAQQIDGNANAPMRDGRVLSDERTQQVLIGFKADLSNLTTGDHPVYFGLLAGVDKFGRELLAFNAQKSEDGQFFQYGRQPLFINLGVGTKIWRGISAGAGARVTLHAEADLDATTTLGGETSEESLQVNAKPHVTPILGVNMDLGDTFCPAGSCWLSGWDVAAAYRGKSTAKTAVNGDVLVDGISGGDEFLPLRINALDSAHPEIYTLGVQYEGEHWRVGATAEHQRWGQISTEFKSDTIKNDGNIDLRNITIPRIGVEYKFSRLFSVMGGLAYEESVFRSTTNPEVNYLDTDRYILGLGGKLTLCSLPFMAVPVTLGFGYQYHYLDERTFELVNFEGTTDETRETVEADGNVHVLMGSLSLRF
ncbi:MAG: aromatic hydrocarbon degradation protein [Halomonadaceae bacterium]|nr:MAG: aromatic hydrocarbon degradation protein [Halomonadaceae bacterium]